MSKGKKKTKHKNPNISIVQNLSPTVQAQLREATVRGTKIALTFCFTVLRDKMGCDDEWCKRFHEYVEELAKEYNAGRVNLKDLYNVQKDEYDTEIY